MMSLLGLCRAGWAQRALYLILLLLRRQCEASDSSVCRSECHMARRRLDVKGACKDSIRTARGESRTSASNTCLSAVYAAFQDECQHACLVNLRSDQAHAEDAQNYAVVDEHCGKDLACRAGYIAGLRQTRDIFSVSSTSDEKKSMNFVEKARDTNLTGSVPREEGAHKKAERISSAETAAKDQPSSRRQDSDGSTLELIYHDETVLIHIPKGATVSEAVLTWCHKNEPENPACPRILLLISMRISS